jgi:hypothetical protein
VEEAPVVAIVICPQVLIPIDPTKAAGIPSTNVVEAPSVIIVVNETGVL